jgi:hypothetical protein
LAFLQEESPKEVERFGQHQCFSYLLILFYLFIFYLFSIFFYNAMFFLFARHVQLTEKKKQSFDILYFFMQFTVYTDYINLI